MQVKQSHPIREKRGGPTAGRTYVRIAEVVAEVELGLDGRAAQAGRLDVGLEVDGLLGLQPDHQLVGRHGPAVEHVGARGRGLELHADLGLAVVQRLARLEDERHPVPAPVPYPEHGRAEGWRLGARRHRGVVQVALVLRVAHVLPQHHVLQRHGRDALQRLHLGVAQIVAVPGARHLHGRLHRHQRQHLGGAWRCACIDVGWGYGQIPVVPDPMTCPTAARGAADKLVQACLACLREVVLEDVADDARLVEVPAAALRPKVLLFVGDGQEPWMNGWVG